MGIDLFGWIEVKNNWREKDGWDGVVKIDFPLTQGARNKEMCGHFFLGQNAVAHCRGLPEILSPEVKELAPMITANYWCISWITWSEILLNIDWDYMSAEWQMLYDIMEALARFHDRDHIRMVVWLS